MEWGKEHTMDIMVEHLMEGEMQIEGIVRSDKTNTAKPVNISSSHFHCVNVSGPLQRLQFTFPKSIFGNAHLIQRFANLSFWPF